MKKKTLIILLLAFTIILFTSCGKPKEHEISDYILDLNVATEDFKILQLSDIHVANKDDRERQFNFLKETINQANADMIIITGDLFTFADRRTAKELFKFLDSFEIPWSITLGNHDEQCYFSVDWLTGYLNKLSDSDKSYCVFKDIQDDNIMGNSNYAINLKKDGELFYQLILMDSNRYYYGDYIGYDYIHEDQIEWYSNLVDYTTSKNNNTVCDSMLFFHIPLPEWYDAIEEIEAGGTDATLITGKMDEDPSSPKYNSGFFDVILDKGSSKAINVGHDHVNNLIMLYKGIYLSYGVNSTDRIYLDELLIGGTVITINADKSISFNQNIRTYEDYE